MYIYNICNNKKKKKVKIKLKKNVFCPDNKFRMCRVNR